MDINIRMSADDAPTGRPIFKYTAYESGTSFSVCESYLQKKKPHLFLGKTPLFSFFIEYEEANEDADYITGIVNEVTKSYYDNQENKQEFIEEMQDRTYVYAREK